MRRTFIPMFTNLRKMSEDTNPIVHIPASPSNQMNQIQQNKKPLKLRTNRVHIVDPENKPGKDRQSNKRGGDKSNKYQETREKIARFLDVTLLISNASTLANVYKNRKFYRHYKDVYCLIGVFFVSLILQTIAAITFMIVKYYTDQMDKIEKAEAAILAFKMESNFDDIIDRDFVEIDGIGRWHISSSVRDCDKIFHQMEELSYRNYRKRRHFKNIGHVCVFVVMILNILGGAFYNVLETVPLSGTP